MSTRLPTPTLLAARGIATLKSRSQSRLHVYLFCVLSHGFSRKRETARSLVLILASRLGVKKWDNRMANLERPELKLAGNVSENVKNFELRFNDYCIQANYRNLAKDPATERAGHYKSPLLEISALRSLLPDEALSVLRYTIEPQIPMTRTKTRGLDRKTTRSLNSLYRELTSPTQGAHRPFQVLDVISSLT